MGMRGWLMPHKLTEIISWPDQCAKAQSYFDTYGWPDNRQEAWKYTSLAHLQDSAFTAADTDDNTGAADIQGTLDGLVINISGGEAQLRRNRLLAGGSLLPISALMMRCVLLFSRNWQIITC